MLPSLLSHNHANRFFRSVVTPATWTIKLFSGFEKIERKNRKNVQVQPVLRQLEIFSPVVDYIGS